MWLTKGWHFRPSEHPLYSFHRFGTFVDGIYAIAATVLVLELRVPDVPEGKLGEAIAGLQTEYIVYALAFTMIVGGWLVTRRVDEMVRGLDHYATLLYLGAIAAYALLPFTVRLITVAIGDREDLQAAVATTSGILLGSMLLYSSFIIYIKRRGLLREGLDPEITTLALGLSRWLWTIPAAALLMSRGAPYVSLALIGIFAVLPVIPFEVHGSEPDQ